MNPRLIAALVLAAATTLSACASDDTGQPDADPSTTAPSGTPSPSPTASQDADVEVLIEGESVKPAGARVDAKRGTEIVLSITSDRAGELHVHSSPEQVLRFPQGSSTQTLTIDLPGVVAIEEHKSGKTIVELEVR